MWETMGDMADRTREVLGTSDVAIVEFRKLMVAAVREFSAGGPAVGTGQDRPPYAQIRSWEGLLPKSTDWRTLA